MIKHGVAVRMYTTNGTMDRSQYVERYAPLVKRMAHHLLAKLPASVEADDIIQAGLIGLMDAATRFEEGQGVQFETYAAQRIRGAMLDELRANDWLPRSIRKSQRALEAAIARVEQRVQRAPNEAEIAQEMALPLPEYQRLVQDARGYQLLYLDDFGDGEDGGGDAFLDRHCPDGRSNPVSALENREFKDSLVAAIADLPEREKVLMGLYYEQELNFREIAAILGVTESRVCQLHGQGVARLRVKLKEWQAA